MKGKDEIMCRKLEKTVFRNELHNEELDDLDFSPNIFQEIKSDSVG